MQPSIADIRRHLLAWYDCERRDLPWRFQPDEEADPYRVWLSEIMLQQTTVAAVAPYFREFTARWPRVEDLATASLDDVLYVWQGLGYYARARNLHACARAVVDIHGGRLPGREVELQRLPGIGPYTAAAIAAIAFGEKTTPVDGNVLRVIARLYLVREALPKARGQIEIFARRLTPENRCGDFAQAMMELGATICTPRRPRCGDCPLNQECKAFATDQPEKYPVKERRKQKPTRYGVAFWTKSTSGAVLLRRREEKGLLGGMMEFPSTQWRERPWTETESLPGAPARTQWQPIPGSVRHTFTHFHLELEVLTGRLQNADAVDGVWCPVDKLHEHALPTVMKKVARHVLSARSEYTP